MQWGCPQIHLFFSTPLSHAAYFSHLKSSDFPLCPGIQCRAVRCSVRGPGAQCSGVRYRVTVGWQTFPRVSWEVVSHLSSFLQLGFHWLLNFSSLGKPPFLRCEHKCFLWPSPFPCSESSSAASDSPCRCPSGIPLLLLCGFCPISKLSAASQIGPRPALPHAGLRLFTGVR